jgi:hypothetical protein
MPLKFTLFLLISGRFSLEIELAINTTWIHPDDGR